MTGTASKIKQKIKEVTSPSPPPAAPSTSSNQPPHKSSSFSNFLHPHSSEHHKSNSTGQLAPPAGGVGAPIQPINSANSSSSIASDPSNYLTDQQLEQDLIVEEMVNREGSIGHQGLPQAGGGHGERSGSTVSAPPQLPPPPPAASEKPSGGMYGGNLFGHGGGGGGKKKGSKQKFAERQVSAICSYTVMYSLLMKLGEKEGGIDEFCSAC
jgi:hypothetical protein